MLEGFTEGKVKVAIGISADKGEKRYLIQGYLSVIKSIIEKGAVVAIFGIGSDKEDAKFLREELREELREGSIIDLVNKKLSMPLNVAIMSQMDMYIGNFNGFLDIAQACHVPVIGISCEAKDRSAKFNGVSQFCRLFPYQVESIVLQPEHPIGNCVDTAKKFKTSSCSHNGEAHCIAQIQPKQIVAAYDKMIDFIKNVKSISLPPVMRNFDNPVFNLQSSSYLKHLTAQPTEAKV